MHVVVPASSGVERLREGTRVEIVVARVTLLLGLSLSLSVHARSPRFASLIKEAKKKRKKKKRKKRGQAERGWQS